MSGIFRLVSVVKLFAILFVLTQSLTGCEDPNLFCERKDNCPTSSSDGDKPEPKMEKGFIVGYWGNQTSIYPDEHDSASNPKLLSQKLDITENGSVFLNWSVGTDSSEMFNVMLATKEDNFQDWKGPNSSNFVPPGITANDITTRFVANPINADGLAFWDSAGEIKVSEFMGSMGHFMGNPISLGEGHVPRIHVDSAGKSYALLQTHMMNGFGLSVFAHTAFATWSDAVQLHRMGMDTSTAIHMPHDSLSSFVDGNDNIFASWLEEQSGNTSLMTSTYDTTNKVWSDPFTILTSTADTHGIDLSAIKWLSASGEHGSAKINLVIYQDTGSEKSIYTSSFDGSDWSQPVRKDMGGMMTIVGTPVSATYHANHVVAWAQSHMSDPFSIKALRFDPAKGWLVVDTVAQTEIGTEVGGLGVALNHSGHAIVTWVESDSNQVRVASSLHIPGEAWMAKEQLAEYPANTVVSMPMASLFEEGLPWVVWSIQNVDGDKTTLTTVLTKRLADINDKTSGETDGGTTGGTDGGSTGGTTGGTDGGTSGGTTEGPIVKPGTDYVSGYWGASDSVASDTTSTTENPTIPYQKFDIADDGTVFLSWPLATSVGESLKTMRARVADSFAWSNPDSAMYAPVGISADATLTEFNTNRTNSDGYAIWSTVAGEIQISEFMGAMGHFMGSAVNVGEGHAPRILVDGTGKAYLVVQAHMANGFGLSVFTRNALSDWTVPAPADAQLHRMGMDAASMMSMSHDSLTTVIDDNNNIVAIWLEEQSGNTRLMKATYDTATGSWGMAMTVLDSMADTHGVDLSAIHSMSASGEHGSANIHLVIYQDTSTEKAIYTTDMTGMTWSHPMRRDTGGMSMITSEPNYTVYHTHHVVTWVESHMGAESIQSLRFTPNSGWGVVEEVAIPEASSTIANLGVALNHGGHAVVTWTETDATDIRILNAIQVPGSAWAHKEIIENLMAGHMVKNLVGVVHEDGTPWAAWNTMHAMEMDTMHEIHLGKRLADSTDTKPGMGGGTDGGTTGGTTGGTEGGGTTGGTDGGGTTGGGTTGGDPAPTPVIVPGTDYVSGYWGESSPPLTTTMAPTANSPTIPYQRFEITSDDAVFLSWPLATTSGESLKVMRATEDPTTGITWTEQLAPAGITATAMMTQYAANKENEGYALWDDAGALKISEFMVMGGIPHFMHTADMGEGHAGRILVDSMGMAYLLKQSHMMNGFGLDVSARTAVNTWDPAVQMHRMGMDAAMAMAMPHDSLTATIDGNDNIFAVWKEEQSGNVRLMSATYDTTAKSWGMAMPILDSTGDTHGIDINAIQSVSLSGEHGMADIHMVIYQDTGTAKSLYTTDKSAMAWSLPMRADAGGMQMMSSAPAYAVNHGSHMVVWAESHMGMDSIQAIRFVAGTGWGVQETVAMPATGAMIDNLHIANNHDGHALVSWTESDSDGVRILNALQVPGMAWAHKEIIANLMAGHMVHNLVGVVHHDGTPWVVWNTMHTMEANTMHEIHLGKRLASSADTQPATGGGTDGGTTGGTDGGGTTTGGTTGGTTDGGTTGETTGGTTDGGTTGGTTGGGTTGGTTGGTDGGGTTTGGTTGGTDGGGTTGGGTTGGSVHLPDMWQVAVDVSEQSMPASSQTVITSPKIHVTNGGNIFASWLTEYDPDVTTLTYTKRDINIMRGVLANDGSYAWSNPSSGMFTPIGYNSDAMDSQFTTNPVTGDGIAVWNSTETINTSEFMGAMGHFMGSSQLPDGHSPKILVDATGRVFLLIQTHMMGGFGLSVYERTARDQWSTTPIQLHRMNMANPISNLNHFIVSVVDGLNNIRTIWLEEQSGVMSLQTATFNTGTNLWDSASMVPEHQLNLNRLANGMANGEPGSDALQLVLHQLNGMTHEIFSVEFNSTSGWQMPMQLDMPGGTNSVAAAPSITTSPSGNILVSWIEKDSAMVASNSSGMMNMIMSKRYMPASGWSVMEHISHVPMSADASSVNTGINDTGDATAVWIEANSMVSEIVASHWTTTNGSWSATESIDSLMNSMGTINSPVVELDTNNVPVSQWSITQSDGVDDIIMIKRTMRLTAIADAQPGTNPDPDPGTDPGPDPGTGEVPVTVNWTTPTLALGVMHSTSNNLFYGPQIELDDLGASMVKMSMADIGTGSNASAIVHNHVVRSTDGTTWNDVLMSSGLMNDLSSNALMETIRAVPTTGLLYGLIRDDNMLYLARYLPNSGWSKMMIPGVPANIPRDNLQLTSNNSGMVTVTWHSPSALPFQTDVHAKHFMTAQGWQPTDTITVAAEALLTPHMVNGDGTVHASWLVSNADLSVGGYVMKMATYTPMVGWGDVSDGPVGLRDSLTKTASKGAHSIVVVTDLSSSEINAFIVQADGTWTLHENINNKVANDGVSIPHRRDVNVIAGGEGHFMVVWRESETTSNGLEVRYMTNSVHLMTDPMTMWHWGTPSEVGGSTNEIESNLNFAMDSVGNSYAVWTSVDTVGGLSHVYVNQSPNGSVWNQLPELLAEYVIVDGSSAHNTSIAINSLDKVGIVWDQHVVGSTISMHHVWAVENK